MQQYENKIKKMENEFKMVMEFFIKSEKTKEVKMMEFKGEVFAKSPSKSATDLHSRYSSNSKEVEILKQKMEEL